MKYSKGNLVYLTVDRGITTLSNKPPEGVKVDTENGTWTNEEHPNAQYNFKGKVWKIGERRLATEKCMRSGIVGIYDRTKLSHLKSLLYADQECRRDDSGWSDAD